MGRKSLGQLSLGRGNGGVPKKLYMPREDFGHNGISLDTQDIVVELNVDRDSFYVFRHEALEITKGKELRLFDESGSSCLAYFRYVYKGSYYDDFGNEQQVCLLMLDVVTQDYGKVTYLVPLERFLESVKNETEQDYSRPGKRFHPRSNGYPWDTENKIFRNYEHR